jgi:hypothetical protein
MKNRSASLFVIPRCEPQHWSWSLTANHSTEAGLPRGTTALKFVPYKEPQHWSLSLTANHSTEAGPSQQTTALKLVPHSEPQHEAGPSQRTTPRKLVPHSIEVCPSQGTTALKLVPHSKPQHQNWFLSVYYSPVPGLSLFTVAFKLAPGEPALKFFPHSEPQHCSSYFTAALQLVRHWTTALMLVPRCLSHHWRWFLDVNCVTEAGSSLWTTALKMNLPCKPPN